MSISELPLCYCTNVHPGRTTDEVLAGLRRYTVPIRDRFAAPLAAGLWLANSVVRELRADSGALSRLANFLSAERLTCHTLNAFPYGDFHDARVKEKVYLPDWTHPDRLRYTLDCARVLSALLPAGVDGSISTLPLGFKALSAGAKFADDCLTQLIACAKQLSKLRHETGKTVRLAIEPEPLCVLETTDEAIEFFRRLWDAAERMGASAEVRTHLGLCYDVCHQAVEFEDAGDSIRRLDSAGVRINKVHLSCALQLDQPAGNSEGRAALHKYVEPRYLHQTLAQTVGGRVERITDLSADMIDNSPLDFAGAPAWRVHFHVPIDAERLGPLATTRPALADALAAVARLDYAPHLEVETYTWEVLPGREPDLVSGLSSELLAATALLESAARA